VSWSFSSACSFPVEEEATVTAAAAAPMAAAVLALPLPMLGRFTGTALPFPLDFSVVVFLAVDGRVLEAVEGRAVLAACGLLLVVVIVIFSLTFESLDLSSNEDFLVLIVELAILCSITFLFVASLADLGGVIGGGEGAAVVLAFDLETTVRPVKLAPIPYLLLLLDFLTVDSLVVGVAVPVPGTVLGGVVEGGMMISDAFLLFPFPFPLSIFDFA
jgi:hypothetical protein